MADTLKAVGILTLLLSLPAFAAEPWADKQQPVSEGLLIWLDAKVQPRAFERNGRRPIADGELVDVWHDGSGNGRHLLQRHKPAQPRFVQSAEQAVVRFDGNDDFLARSIDVDREFFTLFLVAAPRSNAGGFRAFAAAAESGKNDYLTGFNIDQSYFGSGSFQIINVEGPGFQGALDLMSQDIGFGEFHVIEVSAGPRSVEVLVDGQSAGKRPREPRTLRFDEFTLGARLYSNEHDPPCAQGFLDGDVAELLVYDRVLAAAESASVRHYLSKKHERLTALAKSRETGDSHRLVQVENPPAVQVLVPGFSVRQLPIELTNVNNVRYREDGKLIAVTYDGRIHLLSDTDADGLEDKVDLFWDSNGQLRGPIGLALTPPGYAAGRGVFLPSKGKCSLVVDTDGDDRADKEVVLATGWAELPHNVDTLGVAVDPKDHAVFFGIGTRDYTNAYRVKDGSAQYRLTDEHGTIMRIAPDFTSRAIWCTGIRFPVGMAFNSAGDLFCTDQEGATWLANGNPFDELLHIEKGRHYGFPPRHPRHLSGVIDEPSTFDYGPQHQSTCGLTFNEPVVTDGPTFGPNWWAGDALAAGYSRGKLFRTKLVKAAGGYVGKTELFACLNMLTADMAVSPSGDLAVSTHSGGPDWGSGPAGIGKLYKVHYSDRDRPQPVATWASGPREMRVAFDRTLTNQELAGLQSGTRIEFGAYVRAGDRFESLRPGYAVVHTQMATPRHDLAVLGVQVTPDRRSLVIATAPQLANSHFGITLPALGRPASTPAGELRQVPEVDLHYDLTGVTASWQSADGKTTWDGWLPHVDTRVARSLTARSADHETLWPLAEGAGSLTIHTKLDLGDMLRPAVQPGSQIDYQWPTEVVTVVLRSQTPIELRSAATQVITRSEVGGARVVEAKFEKVAGEPIPIEIRWQTGTNSNLELTWYTAEDSRHRALPLHRLLLPWVTESAGKEQSKPVPTLHPALAGGSWARGRQIFYGEKALCGKCHQVAGKGGAIGPNLSNLVQRDYDSVLRDVTRPSYALNPDYLAYTVVVDDGRVLTGALRSDEKAIRVFDNKGDETIVPRGQVESVRPSSLSVMPEGLDRQLGAEAMRDLMAFLLVAGPRMPRDLAGGPPPRSRNEVDAVLAGSEAAPNTSRSLRVLLVAGPKDHGPGEHDYPAWQKAWAELFTAARNVAVDTAMNWPSKEQWHSADIVVLYQHGTWDDNRARDVDAFLARGGGLSLLHFAVDGGKDSASFARRIGLAWQGGKSKFRHGPLDLVLTPRHPITRNLEKVHFHDESYWQLTGDPKAIDLVASGIEDNAPQPLLWCAEHGKGRVFVSILGHYSWTFDDPLFRVLALRGIAWSAHESVDRFNELVLLGAHVE